MQLNQIWLITEALKGEVFKLPSTWKIGQSRTINEFSEPKKKAVFTLPPAGHQASPWDALLLRDTV